MNPSHRRNRSLSRGSGTPTATTPPGNRRRLSVGGTPTNTAPLPRPVTRNAPLPPVNPPGNAPGPMVLPQRTRRDPREAQYDTKLGTIRRLLDEDDRAILKKLTPDERLLMEQVLAHGTSEKATLVTAGYPELDQAIDQAKVIRNRVPAVPPDLDLDGTDVADAEFQRGVQAYLDHLRKEFASQLTELQPDIDRARALMAAGKWNTASFVLAQARARVQVIAATAAVADRGRVSDTRDTTAIDARLRSLDHAALVRQIEVGNFDDAASALDAIVNVRSGLLGAEIEDVTKRMIDAIFASDTALKRVRQDVEFFATLTSAAAALEGDPDAAARLNIPPLFLDGLLARLGTDRSPVLAAVLSKNWLSPERIPANLMKAIVAHIDVADWNRADEGLSARGFNMLWHARDYDAMCQLIMTGVDAKLPGVYGRDTGRSHEGVWSGYIQPLEHLLGNYMRLVSLPPDHKDVLAADAAKIEGARKILLALRTKGKASILTSYQEVRDSEMLIGFEGAPGTIWGFEDVRLPYVQAAHETGKGQQPLRMWELWEAVEQALSQDGYARLLRDPDAVIPEMVDAGAAKVRDGFTTRPKEYAGRDTDAFVDAFKQQCESYLRFLSKQTPAAKFATAELSGRNINKAMGALGCKAGLHWAKEQKAPVYYCLDGINISDATDYKTYKTKKINTALERPSNPKYYEVITLAELREIFTRWSELSGTVKFVRKGAIMKTPEEMREIGRWIEDMKRSDGRMPSRNTPPKSVWKEQIDRLDKSLYATLGDRYAKEIVDRVEIVKLAADAKAPVIGAALAEKDNRLLYNHGILARGTGTEFDDLVNATTPERKKYHADRLRTYYLKDVCDELRIPLLRAVDRLER